MIRRLFAALGLLFALAGLAFAFAPALATLPLSNTGFVFVAGGVAGLLGIVTVQIRRRNPPYLTRPPDPERRSGLPHPGDEIDRVLSTAFGSRGVHAARDRKRLRTRLHTVALGTLMRRENVQRDVAESMLEEGTWTDDPFAARFFSDEASVELPWQTRVQIAVGRINFEERCARRAVSELAAEVAGDGD